jgi:hypothetical protein
VGDGDDGGAAGHVGGKGGGDAERVEYRVEEGVLEVRFCGCEAEVEELSEEDGEAEVHGRGIVGEEFCRNLGLDVLAEVWLVAGMMLFVMVNIWVVAVVYSESAG